jgi:hypothetical protein
MLSLPTCPDDRALRRHIHSIPPHYSWGKKRCFWLDKDIPALGRGLKQFENLERLKVSAEILVVEGWWISDEDRHNEPLAKSGDAEDAYITGVYVPHCWATGPAPPSADGIVRSSTGKPTAFAYFV